MKGDAEGNVFITRNGDATVLSLHQGPVHVIVINGEFTRFPTYD